MFQGLLSTIVLDILREQTDNNLLHKGFVNVFIVCTATGRFLTQIPKSNITPSKPCLLSATLFWPLFSNSLYASCLISRHETPIFWTFRCFWRNSLIHPILFVVNHSSPIPSMYGIYTHLHLVDFYRCHVGICIQYTIHGCFLCQPFPSKSSPLFFPNFHFPPSCLILSQMADFSPPIRVDPCGSRGSSPAGVSDATDGSGSKAKAISDLRRFWSFLVYGWVGTY